MFIGLLATSIMAPYCTLVRVPVPSLTYGQPVEVRDIEPDMDWTDAILSWNVHDSQSARLKVEVSVGNGWYSMADWSGNLNRGPRTSFTAQKTEEAEVQTDVFHAFKPQRKLSLRLTLDRTTESATPSLKLLTICFSNSASLVPETPSSIKAAAAIEAPQLAQGPYEFGKLQYRPSEVSQRFVDWFKAAKGAQYCSPTSDTMLLNFWSENLNRPDLGVDMPCSVASVFDESYPGTGNWSFNTAYLGSFPGMRSYVTRLSGIGDLASLIDSGIPVICSVASNMLKGKAPGGDGHLLLVVGIDEEGSVVCNDPAKADEIRKRYEAAIFAKAWERSGRTVYLCYPEGMQLPQLKEGSVLDH